MIHVTGALKSIIDVIINMQYGGKKQQKVAVQKKEKIEKLERCRFNPKKFFRLCITLKIDIN